MKPTKIEAPALDHDAMMLEKFQVRVEGPGRLERRLAANLLNHIEANGFRIRALNDGDEDVTIKGVTAPDRIKATLELLFNLDEAHISVRKSRYAGRPHWIRIILGEGTDLLNDYSFSDGDADGFDKIMQEFDADDFA